MAACRGPAGRLRSARAPVTALLAAGLIAILAAGCTGTPAPYRATTGTCFGFGVRAIEQRLTVTTMPRACAGLSHAQVNLALSRALRAAVGPRPKAAQRHAAEQESKYLADLFATIGEPARPPSGVGARPGPSGLPLKFAALAAWLATAAAGAYLFAGWLGLTRRHASRARPPAVLAGHAGLALAGLGVWLAFLATGLTALAWLAVAMIMVVAGLGMATLVTGLPDPAAASGGSGRRPTATVIVVAVHGILATAAILLVLLAAIGPG